MKFRHVQAGYIPMNDEESYWQRALAPVKFLHTVHDHSLTARENVIYIIIK